MKKKKKTLSKVKLVKELSRDRIGKVPRTKKIGNKKKIDLGRNREAWSDWYGWD